MKYLSIVFQIPGLSQLHDRHLSLKPSRVLDQHGVQKEPDGRRVRRHEVKTTDLPAAASALTEEKKELR